MSRYVTNITQNIKEKLVTCRSLSTHDIEAYVYLLHVPLSREISTKLELS
jgi:hypothetical protein